MQSTKLLAQWSKVREKEKLEFHGKNEYLKEQQNFDELMGSG